MPSRGEVWLVNLNPTVGQELQKTRPAVVISSDALSTPLQLKTIVPITKWQPSFAGKPWHTKLTPDSQNGLMKDSSADALNVRSVSTQRLMQRLGRLSPEQVEAIAAAIALVVEYQ